MNGTYWRGFWRLADPKISLASFAGIFLGACMAAADQGLAWGWLALTVAGVFCVEIAKNASGELVDYDSGTDLAITPADRSPFSGGKRVLVDKLLTREQIHALTARFFAAAIAIGAEVLPIVLRKIGQFHAAQPVSGAHPNCRLAGNRIHQNGIYIIAAYAVGIISI